MSEALLAACVTAATYDGAKFFRIRAATWLQFGVNGRMSRLASACGAFLGICTLFVSAHAQQRDTFRSSADIVLVDVTATDPDGRPVRGLQAADFQVREDGTAVSIATFREVVVSDSENPRPSFGDDAGSATATNVQRRDGRLILIVIDDVGRDLSAGRMNRANQIALRIIERLGPTDQAGVVATSCNTAYHVQFTSDKARLARVFRGHTFGESNTGMSTLDMLRNISVQLGAIPGRRKILALISEGRMGVGARGIMDPESKTPEMRDFMTTAQRANIAVYTFNPRYAGDLDTMVDHETVAGALAQRDAERSADDVLRVFADNTGGRAMSRSNLFAEAADRMFAESGSYYLLGYYSPKPADDKYRRIQVSTMRNDTSVRARAGYVAAKPGAVGKPVAPIDGLLRSPIQTAGLGLRAAAIPTPSDVANSATVLVVTEIRASDVAGELGAELVVLASTAGGTIRASERTTLKVTGHVDERRWIPVAAQLSVPKGAYQIRIAARRLDGSAEGSTFVDVDVPDFGASLALGGLIVGRRGHAGVANADRLSPFLPVTPVTTPVLPESAGIYGVLPIRISRRAGAGVTYVAMLAGPDNTVRELERRSLPGETFASGRGGSLEVEIPESLDEGEYRLRVEVATAGELQFREIRFRVARGS